MPVVRYGATQARLVGGEARATWAAAHLAVVGEADYVDARDQNAAQPLPGIPPARWIVGTSWRDLTVGSVAHATLGAEIEGQGRTTRPAPHEEAAAPYALLHLGADLAFSRGDLALNLGLHVRNVTDVHYRDFLASDPLIAQSEGRSFELRFSASP